jgi:hypothetical protein
MHIGEAELTQTDPAAISSQLSSLQSLHIGCPTICTYMTINNMFPFVILDSLDKNYVQDGLLYPKAIVIIRNL